MLDSLAPSVPGRDTRRVVSTNLYRGLDGLRRAWTGFVEPFEEMAYELERIIGSGDRVVSIHRVRTKARHTGIDQDFRVAYIWTFRGGRLIHSRGFHDVDEAVNTAGLEE
jgi:ketosteroid isomerase-like protein